MKVMSAARICSALVVLLGLQPLAACKVTQAEVSYTIPFFSATTAPYLAHTGDASILSASAKQATIATVALRKSTTTNDLFLSMVPLVPEKVQVNLQTISYGEGNAARTEPLLVDNPLFGANIHHLTACCMPTDVGAEALAPVASYALPGGVPTNIAWLLEGSSGASILTNTASLRDANGSAIQGIEGLASGICMRRVQDGNGVRLEQEQQVIVAVRGAGKTAFTGTAGDGLAVLQVKRAATNADPVVGLVPVDSSGTSDAVRAVAVADALVQISGSGDIEGINTMYWDPVLQRLFVATRLNDVGGVGVLVGMLSLTASGASAANRRMSLSLQPIIADAVRTNLAGSWDTNNHIVGAKDTKRVEVTQLSVMHTATGHSYLVVVGGVEGLSQQVHALPLVNSSQTVYGDDAIGTLATRTDHTVKATSGTTAQIFNAGEAAALVGGAACGAPITALAIRGDAVYVTLAHATDKSKQGIFSSIALYDANGVIRGWSAWQRVGGLVAPAYGVGRDTQARYWYLTTDGTSNRNTIGLTAWGTGDNNGLFGGTATDTSVGLVAQLGRFFSRARGGVQALFSFDKTHVHLDNSTLLVATGRNEVALALTEKNGVITSGAGFDATTLQCRSLQTDGVDIGIITCAQISRLTSQHEDGYLFVGGTDGLAVLRKSDGKGFESLKDLTTLAPYTFKKILKSDGASFTDVRALAADDTNVYVLTFKNLYKIAYASHDTWRDIGASVLGEESIATPLQLMARDGHAFLTGMLIGDGYVLGTTAGLWAVTGAGKTIKNATVADWREWYIHSARRSGYGVCGDFSYVPATGGGGNLYVLSSDASLGVSVVYRVAISSNTLGSALIEPVGMSVWSYYTILGQLRDYFYTDGAFAYDCGSYEQYFDTNVLLDAPLLPTPVRLLPITALLARIDAWHDSVMPPLAISALDHTVGKVVVDAATGSLLIPGVWGIKVHQ